MNQIHLLGIEEILPSNIILNDFFCLDEIRNKNRMFAGTVERRHMQREELASDFYFKASVKLLARLQVEVSGVDMILTNTSLADEAFTGCGAVVNKKLGAQAKWVLDLHNTGCVSFLYLLDIAQTYFAAGKA